ncbi:hypothetical protein [Pseudomonas aeruginosa]|uniref:hypothetical protein n=1 Tax=Pseudomonas aeruginosa TaxID=287 RepID=UPI0023B7D00A|nr:hypothetical protein [Pseudomonas aeruginosa]
MYEALRIVRDQRACDPNRRCLVTVAQVPKGMRGQAGEPQAGVLRKIGWPGISALGAWLLMGLSPDGSLWAMAIPMLLIGIGNGLPWGLMDALSVSVVPKERAGMAAGIFTTMRVAGEAIAIAAIGAVLVGLTAANLRAAAQAGSLSFPQDATAIASQIGAGAGHGPSTGVVSAMDGTINELVRHAYTSAFHSIFAVLAVLSVLTAVVCILTLRRSADQQAYLWSLEAQANERNNNYWKLSDMDYAICAASWPSPKNCTSPAQQRSCTSSSRPCRAPSRN